MTFFSQLTRESRPTLSLAFPLIAGQLSYMLTALADTVMIGRLGVTPLASATFANTLLYLPLMFGIGLTLAVSIQVSQARGAKEPPVARSALRHGMIIAIAVGLLTVIGAGLAVPVFPWLRQPPDVVAAAPGYFLLVAVSLAPAMGAMVIKNHADAMNRPWPPLFILLAGVAVNVFLNWLFIFGNWGCPAWGLEGAGLATLLARALTLIGLIAWSRFDGKLREWVPARWLQRPDWTELRKLWSLGWPSSLQLLAEISSFVVATLIIGTLGEAALASHQVAITCAATVYMVPVGLSQALTVRIGEAYGARRFDSLRPVLTGGWLMGGLFTCFSASAFVIFHQQIAGLFIEDPAAQATAAALLIVAAAFQFSDAMQIISVGALRGLGEVRFPAWLSFLACWFISIPAGWVFAYPLGHGVTGVWWGFTLGLTTMALTFGSKAWRKTSPLQPRPPYLAAAEQAQA
ncbi:MAG: MATE family efflux transporter [Verrucomicrobiota bacterium JB024]|nr:MATE family efflux transporter [Verrucomicrobiota bacterium JB024]